ncbi:MAG TPA: hypothetical protein VI524_08005 [Anaerolineales bacterium]|nr:hypothetical protein [Anaerolineales bacterium]
MEKRKTKTIFSLVLTIIFLTACSPAATEAPPPSVIPATEEPQVTATEPPVASEGGGMPVTGEGLCANAYYPVRQGATWDYKSTGGPAGDYSYTDTLTSVRGDGFTLTSQFDNDLTRTQEWACEPEGLVALQLGGAAAASLNMGDMQLDLTANNVSGATFPNEINAGDEWQHTLEFGGELNLAGTAAEATGSAQSNFSALGEESVTVPAGTFDAMKVQVDSTIDISASFQGVEVPVTFSGRYTYWFVQGVGWVKAGGAGEFAGTSFTETTELQSYTIP